MSEPKFTKGPWTRDGQFQTSAGDFRLLYDCKAMNITVTADEAAANAALIAAAPEMYEELQEICRTRELEYCRNNECVFCPIGKALKKARGENREELERK